MLLLMMGASGCIKRTVRVPVSSKLLAAKTANLDELLVSLEMYSSRVVSLSSTTLKVTFTSGKLESGKLQAYRSAPGYILLKRPDAIRLNIQNPLTKTSLLELASEGDAFNIWYPRENKFFSGRNSTREFDLEGQPGFTARPIHIFEAILPQKISLAGPDTYLEIEEEQDSVTKYYVLAFFKTAGDHRLRPLRRLWMDRSILAVTRQQIYNESGQIMSLIRYSNLAPVEGLLLPLSIQIQRPLDGYSLDLQFADWRLNRDLPDNVFVLTPPVGAQVVELK